jgi:hypothetical protein
MAEEEFETTEFKEKLDETAEHAHHAENRSRWIVYLSFTTALIAVLAAIAALESGSYSNEALMQKNEALLAQSKASDQWAYYQAKSAANDEAEAHRYASEEQEISKAANELEAEVKKDTELSDRSMEHHHRFAFAVTMFQISIALSAVAALSRQKPVWFIGLLVSVLGLVYFMDGFRLYF